MWSLGRFAEAAADFGRALQLDAEPHTAYLQRGQARFYEGRIDAAAQDFAKAAQSAHDETQRAQALVWHGWAMKRLEDG
jgi:tetratricopeptide (TPR) repeat protein